MTNTNWFGGQLSGSMGPCDPVYKGVPLGKTDQVVFRREIGKTGLTFSQAGDQDDDAVVTSEVFEVEMSLGQATVEVWEQSVQGINVVRDGSENITRVNFSSALWQKDRENAGELQLKERVNGQVSSDPLRRVTIPVAIPQNNVELTYDATTQRYVGALFKVYVSDYLDEEGVPVYAWAGEHPDGYTSPSEGS